MSEFKREIIVFENHFWKFYNELDLKVQEKFDWTITLIERTKYVPDKFLKKLKGTDDLWEIRVKSGNNIYRVFSFFDKGHLIILINGFIKKSQKTPKNEILKAEKLKDKYHGKK